ncbi:MAG: HAD-IIIC family phosphatase, partial [Acidobacteriaceae bacterium]|nr:HAD-IIIC family phosphatase [Acidobacteriaceae bacterium]
MKITEALEILRSASATTEPFELQLACSFTPIHLKTLLSAHLQKRIPERRVTVREGAFGDLTGAIERCEAASLAAVMEWQDLDPRLQYREGGAWGRVLQADLLETARTMLGRIERAINRLPEYTSVAVSLPTLPLPPLFSSPTWQTGTLETSLRRELADFASRIAHRKQLTLISASWLAENSPAATRLDLKSDLLIGFPYTILHAGQVAHALALALSPRQSLKGVITDLDNTLWSGLVGEIGPESVRWDPASRYYLHGLYQKLLAALADEGILVGIASKNDPKVVREALNREDLLISPEQVFPVEVHWARKSESVSRILKTWNISAESVAFVDDTPLELAEVAATHPGITCLQFPAGDYNGVWQLIGQLRDLCGKNQLSEEDTLRLQSIRQGAQFQDEVAT